MKAFFFAVLMLVGVSANAQTTTNTATSHSEVSTQSSAQVFFRDNGFGKFEAVARFEPQVLYSLRFKVRLSNGQFDWQSGPDHALDLDTPFDNCVLIADILNDHIRKGDFEKIFQGHNHVLEVACGVSENQVQSKPEQTHPFAFGMPRREWYLVVITHNGTGVTILPKPFHVESECQDSANYTINRTGVLNAFCTLGPSH